MMEWLLGIDRLDPSDPAVVFGWARPLPAFAWALVIAGAVALAVVSYRGLSGGVLRRLAFGSARALILIALMVLLAGPQLERSNERTEQDWVIVLADRSVSMTIGDGPGGSTRDDALSGAMDAFGPTLAELAETRNVLTLGFDAGVYDLARDRTGAFDPGEASGSQTLLGRSLSAALDRAAARPVAGVVVLSDGASTDEPDRRTVQRLRSERIPVFAVPLGSRDPAGDLAIASVDAPGAGFVGDRIPVRVALERSGAAQAFGGTVELVERSTGIVLATEDVSAGDAEITLVATPDREGDAVWDVRLTPDNADLLDENNSAEVAVRLVDRPLRVLLADGYPRWEFRYLKNLLLREGSIASSSLLLATGRRHIQEGDVLIARMP
ncbi:MAG: vWA domain-containing protein, partial [Planctomycetota bacterium]